MNLQPLSAPFAVDIERLLLDDNRTFNPLGKNHNIDIQVVDARNGYAQLSVVLPVEMTRHFSRFLESMTDLLRCSGHKARIKNSVNEPIDPEKLAEQAKFKQSFANQICTLFDGFIDQGLTRNQAISRTNSAMKEQNHPWASYDIVKDVLRKNLRFRKRGNTVN